MIRGIVGLAMRVYRASPLHPHCGKLFAKILSIVAPRRSAVTEINGVKFDLDLTEVIDSSLYYSGSFEPQAEKIIAGSVRPGNVAIDVGANIGYHTFTLAKGVGPSGMVLAVEPMAHAFEKLRRNLALNNFQNVRLVKCGLAASDTGETEIRFQSSYRLDGGNDESAEKVRLVTLDTLVREQNLARVDFIKMDVDGFEVKAMSGARETLERFRPVIFFEFAPGQARALGDRPEELLEMLKRLGYELFTEDRKKAPEAAEILRGIQATDGSINLLAVCEKSRGS